MNACMYVADTGYKLWLIVKMNFNISTRFIVLRVLYYAIIIILVCMTIK